MVVWNSRKMVAIQTRRSRQLPTRLTTMNPESRRLIKVMPTDVERTAQVFDILLGDNLAGRKEHIAQHGAEYLDDLDVS